jgi:hypothetical protein
MEPVSTTRTQPATARITALGVQYTTVILTLHDCTVTFNDSRIQIQDFPGATPGATFVDFERNPPNK